VREYFSHYLHFSPVAILLCMTLAGCAGLHGQKHENRNIAADEKIATDTVNQLARLYPPAKTQFNLVLSEPRSFGAMLGERLRGKGYAVSETIEAKGGFSMDAFSAAFPRPAIGNGQEAKTPETMRKVGLGMELRYTLDDARTDPLLRITVKVGSAYLARAYLADNGDVAAAGAWTYRGE
jgi:type IV secretion system protein TrbH